MIKKEYELMELPNGIRVIHKEVNHTEIAHVGIMLDIGSRDEFIHEQGLTHFTEHMVFRGTAKRSSYHIINRLESYGGELNAYTSKEKICFYTTILDIHLDKAIELLCDITFNATFSEKQIEKERMVILEEMGMYRDTPEDSIQDEFDEQLFPNHPLGRNILGTEKTVRSFQQKDFKNFLARNMNTEKIILSSVGNYSVKKIQRLVTKYLKDVSHKNDPSERVRFSGYQPTQRELKKSISQAYFAMGIPSPGVKDKNRIPFFFLVNLLGGPSMNSRLNLSMREKHGLVYSVDAHYIPYLEVGQFVIYFATDAKNLTKSRQIILKEINVLKQKLLGNIQLHKAKNQMKGQMALSEENQNSIMLMMAKSQLSTGSIPNINSIFDQIDGITASDIQDLAKRYFPIEKMSSLSYLPE